MMLITTFMSDLFMAISASNKEHMLSLCRGICSAFWV